MEVWKDIPGYEGLYQVSNLGRVKSLPRLRYNGNTWYLTKEIVRKPCIGEQGYERVTLSKDKVKKTHLVHRLVAIAFIPNPENKPEVNHIREFEKRNNCVDNLEWATSEENNNWGTHNERHAKRRSKQILCVELNKLFVNARVAAEELRCDRRNICTCCNDSTKTAGGYHWRYAE